MLLSCLFRLKITINQERCQHVQVLFDKVMWHHLLFLMYSLQLVPLDGHKRQKKLMQWTIRMLGYGIYIVETTNYCNAGSCRGYDNVLPYMVTHYTSGFVTIYGNIIISLQLPGLSLNNMPCHCYHIWTFTILASYIINILPYTYYRMIFFQFPYRVRRGSA